MFTTNSISRPTDPLFTTASLSASVERNHAIAMHFGRKHGALFDRKAAGENLGHRFEHVGGSDVGHESEAALVDADEGHVVGRQVSRGVEHASVASLHHHQIGPSADLVVIGYGKAAHVVGS